MTSLQRFLCHDILSTVFEHLAPGDPLDTDEYPVVVAERMIRRRTLASSARVCKAFSAPALDVLWRLLDNIELLLRLFSVYLPSESVGIVLIAHSPLHAGHSLASLQSFIGAITEQEWLRFQEYASRVHQVSANFGKDPGSPEQEQVWMVLLQKSRGLPLLPCLETLIIRGSLGGLTALLGPTVHDLNFYLPIARGNGRTGNILTDVVRSHLSHIRTLTLYEFDERKTYTRSELLRLPMAFDICTLTHVRYLDVIHPVLATRSVIQGLMALPNLCYLYLNFDLDEHERFSLSATKFTPGFLQLRAMHLDGSFQDIATFLEVTDPPELETLGFTQTITRGASSQLDNLAEAYAKIPPHISRLHLRFFAGASDDRYIEPELTPLRILPPSLHSRPDLREVIVTFRDVESNMGNDDLAALAAAWPALERFEYNSRTAVFTDDLPVEEGRPAARTLPTFDTLLAFTQAHPRLERLCLPALAPEGIPDVSGLDSGLPRDWPQAGHALRVLWLGVCVEGTPMLALALALDRAFPGLELGNVRSASIQKLANGHDTLLYLLLALQTTRRSGKTA